METFYLHNAHQIYVFILQHAFSISVTCKYMCRHSAWQKFINSCTVSYPFHKFQSSAILSSTWVFIFCYILSTPPNHWYPAGLLASINQTDILSSPASFPCASLLIVISKCNILFSSHNTLPRASCSFLKTITLLYVGNKHYWTYDNELCRMMKDQ
jgi:hypothetical protein